MSVFVYMFPYVYKYKGASLYVSMRATKND